MFSWSRNPIIIKSTSFRFYITVQVMHKIIVTALQLTVLWHQKCHLIPHFHGHRIQWASSIPIWIGSFLNGIHSIIRQSIKLYKSVSWMSLIWNLATFEQSVHLHISMQNSPFLRQAQLVITQEPWHPHFTSSRTALGPGSIRHMVGRYTLSEPRSHTFISSAGRTGFAITYDLSFIEM